jgi:hypothetical protein
MLSFAAVECESEWGTGSNSVSYEREVKEKMRGVVQPAVTLHLVSALCTMCENNHIALSDSFLQLHIHSIVNKGR